MLLIAGTLLLLIGGALLLWTTGYLRNLGALWPALFVVLGLALLYFVFFRGGNEMYTFPGMLMAVGGLYYLLGTSFMPWHDLIRIWPVFMAIAGVSIIPYAMMKRGNARAALLVPGFAIVVLAAIFLPFSLHLISQKFSHVAYMWWPLLVVVLGLFFLVTHLVRSRKSPYLEADPDDTSEQIGGEE